MKRNNAKKKVVMKKGGDTMGRDNKVQIIVFALFYNLCRNQIDF